MLNRKELTLFNDLQNLLDSIQNLRKKIQKSQQTLRRLLRKKDSVNPYELERAMINIEKEFSSQQFKDIIEELELLIKSSREKINELKKNYYLSFGLKLEKLLKESGFSFKGSYPILHIDFYTLKIDFERNKASLWYGPEKEFITNIQLYPLSIVKVVKKVHSDLIGHLMDEKIFLKTLYKSYKLVLMENGLEEGANAPIIQVLNRLAFLLQDRKFHVDPKRQHYKSYGRIQFSYDLFRLKNKIYQGKRLELEVATLAQSRDKSKHLWIPESFGSKGTIYSYIRFRRV